MSRASTANISRSSVITTPSNLSVSLITSCTGSESEAGFSLSIEFTVMCDTRILSAPAAIPA